MIDLSRHIEYLLLDSDSVSVPQLGTFSAEYVPSRRVEEEDLFLPPYRSVSFSLSVDEGDDSFVRSLTRVHRLTEQDAAIKCLEFADSVRQEVAESGSSEIGSIGYFVQGGDQGGMRFVPCEGGVASPALYGLDSVGAAALGRRLVEERHADEAGRAAVKVTSVKADAKTITIRVNRRLFNYVAAVAAT